MPRFRSGCLPEPGCGPSDTVEFEAHHEIDDGHNRAGGRYRIAYLVCILLENQNDSIEPGRAVSVSLQLEIRLIAAVGAKENSGTNTSLTSESGIHKSGPAQRFDF